MSNDVKTSNQSHYNTLNPFVVVKGGAMHFIDFVEKVFGGKENLAVRTPDNDGTLIHAEIQIGDSMLLLADSKPDWVFTPALLQVYVPNAQEVLDKGTALGATVITEVNPFYNGIKLASLKDKWGNLWWLYEKDTEPKDKKESKASTDWHNDKPSEVYTTLMEAMKTLKPDEANW